MGIKLENFIKILKNNGYEIEKIADNFIMIKTKETFERPPRI